MVHLHVHIQVVIAVPWGMQLVGPKPLQIWRQQTHTGTANTQVAAILVKQHRQQFIVIRIAMKADQPLIGCFSIIGLTKIYAYAVKQLLEPGGMLLF